MANDALVKLLNSFGYQPVFLPRTNVAPPELYGYVNDRLIRYGPLRFFLQQVDQLSPTRGAMPDLYQKETTGKDAHASVSFLENALRALGIAGIPKLDLSFAGKSELVFSFSEVSYVAVDPVQLYTVLQKFLAFDAIPNNYINAGRLHVAYEYLYSRRLVMSRADHKSFDIDVSGKIGDFIDLGTAGHVDTDGGTVVSFAPLTTELPAFAYKAGRVSREGSHWVFEPEIVGAKRAVEQPPVPYIPQKAAVLKVDDASPDRVPRTGLRAATDISEGGNQVTGLVAKTIARIQQTPRMQYCEPATLRGIFDEPLPVAMIRELKPYVVNLEQGKFSHSGNFRSSPEQVDVIMESVAEYAESKGPEARVMLFAHGGTVDERTALQSAYKCYGWWVQNGVYPVYFVWETGVLETIDQFLSGAMFRMRAAEGLRDVWDWTTDPVIEKAARAAQIGKLWTGMKHGAVRAAEPDSDAIFFTSELAKLCARYPKLQIHAVGHSAGSIFQSYVLPAAVNAGLPAITSLHLLAPAIRNDVFANTLLPAWEAHHIIHVDMFTMKEKLEKDDNCAGVYRKSLLYLVYHALEDKPNTPILGLAECLEQDKTLSAAFGLNRHSLLGGEVIWSESHLNDFTASASRTHGGFDDDAATMESVLRRICGYTDGRPIVGFPSDRAAAATTMIQHHSREVFEYDYK
jgi:hypothetical protein